MAFFGAGLPENDNWIQGLGRENHPLMQSPEDFMRAHPTWENALQRYFLDNPDTDCPANRAALALYMQRNYAAAGFPQRAIQSFGSSSAWPAFLNNAAQARNERNGSVALSILKVIGQIFLNIITVGLYGVVSIYLQKKSIVKLTEKNAKHAGFVEESLRRMHVLKNQTTAATRVMQGANIRIAECEQQVQRVRDELAALPEADPRLMERLEDEKRKLDEARELFRTIASTYDEDEDLGFATPTLVDADTAGQPKNGWAKPLYTIKVTDPRKVAPRKRAGLDECSTMQELLTSEFKIGTRELLQKAGEGKIRFNRSSKLLSEMVQIGPGIFDKKHGETISSIYKWMAYRLLVDAGVKTKGSDQPLIVLNDSGLTVGASQPFWVNEREVLFNHHDAWTPPLDPPSNGVDPVSAYYIIQGMSPEVRSSFEALILSPMIPHQDGNLKKAKSMKEEKSVRGEALRNAEGLISDIASALQRRYQDALDDAFGDFADDDSAEVFFKEAKEPEPETVEDDEETELKKIEKWNPLELPLAFEDTALIADLEKTRQQITPIWNNIRQCLANPLADDAKIKTLGNIQDLRSQYYTLHLGIGGNGCLFSALAGALLQGASSKDKIDPKRLKRFIAAYLEAGAGVRLSSFILAETKRGNHPGWPWNFYANYLKGIAVNLGDNDLEDRGTSSMGDLEIELLCRALGLHVEVFTEKCSYTVKDGRMTSTRHYGAVNAKERITLFCSDGYSWYAAFPRVRAPRGSDPAPVVEALNYAKKYWEQNDGIEYGSWSTFRMPNASPLFS